MKEFSEKDFLLLAYLEGDLTETEKVKFEDMLANDAALMQEYKLLCHTILPVEEIVYTSKADLKKPVTTQKLALGYLFWSGAVAACLAVLILFYSPTIISTPSNIVKVEKENTHNILTPNLNIDKSAPLAEVNKGAGEIEITKKSKRKESGINPLRKEYIDKVITTKETDVEFFEKQEFTSIPLLAIKEANIPLQLPLSEVKINTNLGIPQYTPIVSPDENYENKGWFARASQQINNKLNKWVSYLEKPKVGIDKKEPIGGRIYWAISVEADKYEWEGRLYTYR